MEESWRNHLVLAAGVSATHTHTQMRTQTLRDMHTCTLMNPCVEGVLTLKRNGNVCPKRLGTTVPRHAGLSSIHCWRVLPESVCEGQFGCVPILGGGRRGTLSASQIPLATHTTRTTLTGATHHSSAKGLLSSMAPPFSLASCATCVSEVWSGSELLVMRAPAQSGASTPHCPRPGAPIRSSAQSTAS